MNTIDIKQKITKTLDTLNDEQLSLVEKLLIKMTAYFQTEQPLESSSDSRETTDDPLTKLRNSDSIGCFEDDPNLAEDSEKLAHEILSKGKTELK